jgi:transposase
MEEDPKALARQRVILAVLAERLTVTQAAQELGVSRKTYYEWQERALSAMRTALTDRPGGRPPNPVDPEKQQLQETVATLEQERQLLEGRLLIQEAIRDVLAGLGPEAPEPKKKTRGANGSC